MATDNTPQPRILTPDDARREAHGLDFPLAPQLDLKPGEVSRDMSKLPWGHLIGIPKSGLLAVLPVDDSASPETVADFLWLLVTVRQGGKLVELTVDSKGRPERALFSRWLLWGSLNESPTRALVVGSLSVAPARRADELDAASRGVTTELLRLVSPPAMAARASEGLRQRQHQWRMRGEQTPVLDRVIERLDGIRTVAAATPEDQIRRIATRYVELCRDGVTRPLTYIADEYGLTREQARDRVRRARSLEYLQPGESGRASGEPGPRLLTNDQRKER